MFLLALTLVASVVTAVPAGSSERERTVMYFPSPVQASAYLPFIPIPVVGYNVGFRARLLATDQHDAFYGKPAPVPGRTISFWADDLVGKPRLLCTGTTRADGYATCQQVVDHVVPLHSCPCAFPWLPRRTDKVFAQFKGDRTYFDSSAEAPWVSLM